MTMKNSHYVLKLELIRVTHEEGEKATQANNWKEKERKNEDTTLVRVAFTDENIETVLTKGITILDLYAGE